MLSRFSHGQLFVILWTVAHQASLSMGFSRQEYWSGLPCPPRGDLPELGTEPTPPMSSALQAEIHPSPYFFLPSSQLLKTSPLWVLEADICSYISDWKELMKKRIRATVKIRATAHTWVFIVTDTKYYQYIISFNPYKKSSHVMTITVSISLLTKKINQLI